MDYTRLSDANVITEKYMDSLLIEERLIDSVVADISTTFLGERFDMPVMTPAFSHLPNYNGREYNGLEEYSQAAKECNILNFCGMMENDQFKRLTDTGARTVRIVKPYADHAKVIDQMQYAESVGAFGIGMDIDHIFGEEGADRPQDGEEERADGREFRKTRMAEVGGKGRTTPHRNLQVHLRSQ